MAKTITTIPATINKFTAAPMNSRKKRKVAGYARVSTDHEEQATSYEAQVKYYTDYIKGRDDWEFVKVYTDAGISGCNTKHRSGFNHMVEDALAGKIDLIITKSVSRFARNTVDSLSTIRKLKDQNVECYFEKENIWTFDGKGELLLTIMSSLAQEESRSISENVKWGKRKRMADGKVCIPFRHFLGFRRGANGEILIDEEQAVIVRRIYRLYLDGLTPHAIAKRLTDEKIPSPSGKDTWNQKAVQSILTNEKYMGDALLQKVYVSDFLTKKIVKNQGEIPQYYVKDNHEAIVSREVFETVQLEMERRKQVKGRYSGIDMLSSKLRCGQCGGCFGAKVWHSNDKYRRVIYQCNQKFKEKCSTPHLTEDEIKERFAAAVNKLLENRSDIIANLEIICEKLCDNTELEVSLEKERTEMNMLYEALQNCINENARIAQDQDEYNKRYNALSEKFEKAQKRIEEFGKEISHNQSCSETMRQFIETLKEQKCSVTEFDESLWGSLLECVTVYEKDDVRFTFRDGTEIKA